MVVCFFLAIIEFLLCFWCHITHTTLILATILSGSYLLTPDYMMEMSNLLKSNE